MRLLRNDGGLPSLCQDPHSVAELSQAEPFSLEKEAPFGQWLSQTRGVNVSGCDMDRGRVSDIAGLCLTANLTASLV